MLVSSANCTISLKGNQSCCNSRPVEHRSSIDGLFSSVWRTAGSMGVSWGQRGGCSALVATQLATVDMDGCHKGFYQSWITIPNSRSKERHHVGSSYWLCHWCCYSCDALWPVVILESVWVWGGNECSVYCHDAVQSKTLKNFAICKLFQSQKFIRDPNMMSTCMKSLPVLVLCPYRDRQETEWLRVETDTLNRQEEAHIMSQVILKVQSIPSAINYK